VKPWQEASTSEAYENVEALEEDETAEADIGDGVRRSAVNDADQ
jgi:hypothetical protein